MEKLLTRARQGDKSAEEEIVRFLLVRFTYLAKRRVPGEEAEDIAHDACLTVLQKYMTEGPTGRFEPWAYGILKRKIGNYYQRREVRQTVMADEMQTDTGPKSEAAESAQLMAARLRDCLRKLVRAYPRYARVLNLVYQGYDTIEICRRLEVKPNNLYVILNRGREMLGACLDRGGFE